MPTNEVDKHLVSSVVVVVVVEFTWMQVEKVYACLFKTANEIGSSSRRLVVHWHASSTVLSSTKFTRNNDHNIDRVAHDSVMIVLEALDHQRGQVVVVVVVVATAIVVKAA